jgi:hypothetical protein
VTTTAYQATLDEARQMDAELAASREREAALRELLRRSDRLLWRAERANLRDAAAISNGLRTAIRALEREVLEVIPPGPTVPQMAVGRLFRVQDQLLFWLHPEFKDREEPDPGPDADASAYMLRLEAVLADSGPAGFAWSDVSHGYDLERRRRLGLLLESWVAEGRVRVEPARGGYGQRYVRAEGAR